MFPIVLIQCHFVWSQTTPFSSDSSGYLFVLETPWNYKLPVASGGMDCELIGAPRFIILPFSGYDKLVDFLIVEEKKLIDNFFSEKSIEKYQAKLRKRRLIARPGLVLGKNIDGFRGLPAEAGEVIKSYPFEYNQRGPDGKKVTIESEFVLRKIYFNWVVEPE